MLPCLPVGLCVLIVSPVNILRISTVVHMAAFVNLILKTMMRMMMEWYNVSLIPRMQSCVNNN